MSNKKKHDFFRILVTRNDTVHNKLLNAEIQQQKLKRYCIQRKVTSILIKSG